MGDEDVFSILHLSGIEHQLTRRLGYEKGMASMTKLSWAVMDSLAANYDPAKGKALGEYVGLIPFYGGQGFKTVNSTRPVYDPKVCGALYVRFPGTFRNLLTAFQLRNHNRLAIVIRSQDRT